MRFQKKNTLQGHHDALNQEISRLTADNQQFRQAGSPGLAEIATTVVQAVQTSISNANPRSNEPQSVVDIKSLGKPPMFKREANRWKIKVTSSRVQQFGPLGAQPVDDVQEKSEQVHVALLALIESESFDIVLGAAPSGLEALKAQSSVTTNLGASCMTFPQELRNGKNWFAETKGANRAEERQQPRMMTSRQLHSKPLFRVNWNNVLP